MTDIARIFERTWDRQAVTMQSPSLSISGPGSSRIPNPNLPQSIPMFHILTEENMYERKYFEAIKAKVIRLFHRILQWKALLID